jgi:hypothetical protein
VPVLSGSGPGLGKQPGGAPGDLGGVGGGQQRQPHGGPAAGTGTRAAVATPVPGRAAPMAWAEAAPVLAAAVMEKNTWEVTAVVGKQKQQRYGFAAANPFKDGRRDSEMVSRTPTKPPLLPKTSTGSVTPSKSSPTLVARCCLALRRRVSPATAKRHGSPLKSLASTEEEGEASSSATRQRSGGGGRRAAREGGAARRWWKSRVEAAAGRPTAREGRRTGEGAAVGG